MKHAKLIAILMAVLCFVGLLSGCSGTDAERILKDATDIYNLASALAEEYGTYEDYAAYDEDAADVEAVQNYQYEVQTSGSTVDLADIPEYWGNPYVIINDNTPFFETNEYTTEVFEYYSPLDNLGRCGVAYANICQELMPTEERGNISAVHPSGWTSGNEPGNWNRCHLIGFQLAGENDNELNLVTGTRYMNVDGMLPFENEIANYVHTENNHVLYRVTPLYEGDDLVCKGVLMEAYSVEDNGQGVQFNVFCYNIQPGVVIDYATGESWYTA